jgi:hypothetical protein
MRDAVGLLGILDRVVDDQQLSPETCYAAVDAGREQPARTTLDTPATHSRLVLAEPEAEVVGVLVDQLPRLTAVRLGEFVAVGHQDDLEVGVAQVGDQPFRRAGVCHG